MQVVEKVDDDGDVVGYAVVVDGEEVESFGAGELASAIEHAEALINPLPKP